VFSFHLYIVYGTWIVSGTTLLATRQTGFLFTDSMERVLPEKLTGPHPVKKFPAFYGTRRFITAFTSARLLPLS